jgi:PPOX class F420-dependent enzyme/OxyR family protein
MSVFSANEIEYLNNQQLGRLATVNGQGDPHVVPVGFQYNAQTDTIDIGGRNMSRSVKYREAITHGRVAFVVDDVLPPWQPRGIEIRGTVEANALDGKTIDADVPPEIIRIRPQRIRSWGLDNDAYDVSPSRKVQNKQA